MQVTGLETVDWHQLGWTAFAFVCGLVALVLVFPPDPGVRHKKDDDDHWDDYPRFPPY